MKRYDADHGIPTLALALSVYMKVEELKKLASLAGARLPNRKGELMDFVVHHLEGEGLRAAWQSLDELQRAAVAEVVHSGEAIRRFAGRLFSLRHKSLRVGVYFATSRPGAEI